MSASEMLSPTNQTRPSRWRSIVPSARLPSADYIAYLVHLAAARGLPQDYQAELRGVPVAALAA